MAFHKSRLTKASTLTLALSLLSTSLLTATATATATANHHDHAAPNKATTTAAKCERLPTSLTYSQDAAPTDVSGILRVVVEKINRDVTGVVDVEVAWSGAELHKRVGERIVKCTVTRLLDSVQSSQEAVEEDEGGTLQRSRDELGRDVITQCFEVPITVLDINECTVPKSNSMAHRCHESSVCVNTLGSYECVCPSDAGGSTAMPAEFVATLEYWNQLHVESQSRSPWELAFPSSTETSCPGLVSTHGCCDEGGQSKEGQYCRSSFKCPIDPCATGSGGCASNAQCQRSISPLSHPNHTCLCPRGYMGNGRACVQGVDVKPEPKVRYDGVTPTEETRRKLEGGLICGCSLPVVDACSGFPKCPGKHEMCTVTSNNTPQCACQPGYVHDDHYGCVDENPPILHLKPDPTHTDPKTGITRLSQGDKYVEYGVDVDDKNAEEYLRSLKMTYSRPLPQGCLLEMGEFYVNYTVATPWTHPEFVRAKRTVVIENVNECKVMQGLGVGANCPELVAMCDADAGAMCIDAAGTYSCKCPKGTEGDGFRPIPRLRPNGKGGFEGIMVPRGYLGGTGCRDTSRPVIEILGPNPKTFRVAKVSGLKGIMRMGEDKDSNSRAETLIAEQRSGYESDLRSMIKATSGAELCATSAKPNVQPLDCIRAKDHTYKGVVDLTGRVSVGEPISKDGSPLHWRVPYNVMDDAGNKAKTVWRDINVEEVDLDDFERKTKSEILANRKDEVDNSIKEALIKERKRVAAMNENNKVSSECSACKPCNCKGQNSNGNLITFAECNKMCEDKIAEAASSAVNGDRTCTPSYLEGVSPNIASGNKFIHNTIAVMEGLIGPSAFIFLLMGCTLATLLYVFSRMIGALFSTGPNVQTYYHSSDDDEREKVMMQNVSYYRSPTPSNGTRQSPGSVSSIPRPPTASMSSQRNGIFSPQQNRTNGGTPQQQQGQSRYSSPFADRSKQGENGTSDNIYQSMSPITPMRSSGTPASSVPNSQGSRYNLRSTNY